MSFKSNDIHLKSWVNYHPDTEFPIQNLPLGIGQMDKSGTFVASRIGDQIINIAELYRLGLLDGLFLQIEDFESPHLNALISKGKNSLSALRDRLSDLLNDKVDYQKASTLKEHFLLDLDEVEMLLPIKVGDYTDFYSSKEHATNVGIMFRDPENALLPNWLHLPVGYHGRASSIVVSGTPIKRPMGQTLPDGANQPIFGPCRLMDFELEMGFVVGRSNPLGQPISIDEAEDYIAGLLLFNDWSARDIQKWEYVPLGPFGAKNFASTISPWLVLFEALEPFRTQGPEQSPQVLPYLQHTGAHNFDIHLAADLLTSEGNKLTISKSNFKYMYWSMAQQLTHHTITGCNMQVGDICASGTISGPTPDSYGSMLELSWKGTKPLKLSDGSERKFLLDGDTIRLRGYGEHHGIKIGFGPCEGTIYPA
jgi:fumarylacetoacetase